MINSVGKDVIQKVVEVFKNNLDIVIMVEGYMDIDGDVVFNWDLSVGWAIFVVKVFIVNGVDLQCIMVVGCGEFYFVVFNDIVKGKV